MAIKTYYEVSIRLPNKRACLCNVDTRAYQRATLHGLVTLHTRCQCCCDDFEWQLNRNPKL